MTNGEIAEVVVGEADCAKEQVVAEATTNEPAANPSTLVDAKSEDTTTPETLAVPSGVTVEEMADELKVIENEEDRAFAEGFIGLLGKGGLGKEKVSELLKGLAELNQPEDPKTLFKKELEKLGADGKELIGKVRKFRDAMRDTKEFSDAEVASLEMVTQTADGVRLVAKILEKAQLMDAGKFSNYRAGLEAEELSHEDRIRLYEKAFSLRHTNPAESRAEIARLDKTFVK